MENWDGETTCGRSAVERDRAVAAAAQGAAAKVPGTQADRQPTCAHGHRVRVEDWHCVGGSAAGTGLRQRDVVLAADACVAGGRSVGPAANAFDRAPGSGGKNRLVSRGGGFQQCAGGFWGAQTGPNPVDRAKPGSKHHVLTDAGGIPLVTALSAANHHDSRYLFPLLIGLPARLRAKIESLYADRAYDCAAFRQRLQEEGIEPFLAKRGTVHGSGLGRHRWVVERAISWLHQFRRLRIRYERHGYMHRAFLSLAASLIAVRHLKASFC
jgi:transposase